MRDALALELVRWRQRIIFSECLTGQHSARNCNCIVTTHETLVDAFEELGSPTVSLGVLHELELLIWYLLPFLS